MKRCFKCGIEKPRSEFYRHPQMADGLLGKCKDCTKRDVKTDRRTSPNARIYDRNRSSQPHRIALRERIVKEWRIAHPDRAKAHYASSNAVRDRRLAKATVCENCGQTPKRIEKHHPDYSQPLLVMWLCKPCHCIADRIRRRIEAWAA